MYFSEQWNKIIISDEQRSYLLAFVDKPEPQQMVISQNIAGHLQVRILALTGTLEVVICVCLSICLLQHSFLQNCSSFQKAIFKLASRSLSSSSLSALSLPLSQLFLSSSSALSDISLIFFLALSLSSLSVLFQFSFSSLWALFCLSFSLLSAFFQPSFSLLSAFF